jgi:drug/metabolite transporter (DMT)-like permease
VAAVGLAVASAVLFGAMSVTLRLALRRHPDPEVGALATAIAALVPCGAIAAVHADWRGNVWPFLLAGLLAPGGSQILYMLAIRDCGPSRTSVLVGVAPLVSVTIAFVALGEPVRSGIVFGAVLIVVGGLALVGERVRPEDFRRVGGLFALGAGIFFASRDNVVRHFAVHSSVPHQIAACMTLLSGGAVMSAYAVAVRGPRRFVRSLTRSLVPFAPGGILWGLSYAALYAAFFRGRVSVISPLVATESLFGVVFSALVLRRSELVSRHVWLGAALIVAGGALIGAFR